MGFIPGIDTPERPLKRPRPRIDLEVGSDEHGYQDETEKDSFLPVTSELREYLIQSRVSLPPPT